MMSKVLWVKNDWVLKAQECTPETGKNGEILSSSNNDECLPLPRSGMKMLS